MDGNADDDLLFEDLNETTMVNDTKPSADASNSEAQAKRLAQYAVNLRDNVAAGWLLWMVNSTLSKEVDPDAFLVYRDVLLKKAGQPTDPIERMLIEQLALAHFSIGQLRIRSCSTDMPKMTIAFSDAATRLFAEFQRSVLALKEYRGKRAQRTQRRDRTERKKPLPPAKVNGHARPRDHARKNKCDAKLVNSDRQKRRVTAPVNSMDGDLPPWVKNRIIPNPHRVAAGRRNRPKRKGLAEAGRQRLRAAALRDQPWRYSTGPRSPAGKAQAALNGKRGQVGEVSQREIRRELAGVESVIERLAAIRRQLYSNTS